MKNTTRAPKVQLTGIIAMAAIIVFTMAACTPKKSEAEKPVEVMEEETTVAETPIEYFSIKYMKQEESPFVVDVIDEDGDCFYFNALKSVKNISIIDIGFDDDFNFYQSGILFSLDNHPAFVIKTYASATIPNRGISFTDVNGTHKYFYITFSGEDGSAMLIEFQNTPPAGFRMSGALDGVITAQIENGDELDSIISELSLFIYSWNYNQIPVPGSYSNGILSVTLPQTLNAMFLTNVEDIYHGYYGWHNNKHANVLEFSEIHGFDSSGSLAAVFTLHHGDESYVRFWYTDRDVTIDGVQAGGSFNLILKRGWNKVYASNVLTEYTDVTGRPYVIRRETTTPPDGDLKWRFEKRESG